MGNPSQIPATSHSPRNWLAVLALFLLLPLGLPAETIEWTDEGVEFVMRRALGIEEGPIPREAVASLTTLDARVFPPQPQIESTADLRHATSLQFLNLTNNGIGDEGIAHLGEMTQLRWLYVGGNNLADLSWVSGLTNLVWFAAQANSRIESIEPLRDLHSLERLYLGGNLLEDISPVTSLPNLTHLYLELNRIRSIDDLDFSELEQLRVLSFNGNRLSSLTSLAGHTGIRELYIARNRITSHQQVPSLPNLQRLDIRLNLLNFREGTANAEWAESMIELAQDPENDFHFFAIIEQGSLWTEAPLLTSDGIWRFSHWMGFIWLGAFPETGFTWVQDLGWIWADSWSSPDGVWFYSVSDGDYYYTNDLWAPYAWRAGTGEYVRWIPDLPPPPPEAEDTPEYEEEGEEPGEDVDA